MAAVQQDGRALEYASEDLKNNEAVVTAAAQGYWRALEYASEDLKSNEAIVNAVVQQNWAIQEQYPAQSIHTA